MHGGMPPTARIWNSLVYDACHVCHDGPSFYDIEQIVHMRSHEGLPKRLERNDKDMITITILTIFNMTHQGYCFWGACRFFRPQPYFQHSWTYPKIATTGFSLFWCLKPSRASAVCIVQSIHDAAARPTVPGTCLVIAHALSKELVVKHGPTQLEAVRHVTVTAPRNARPLAIQAWFGDIYDSTKHLSTSRTPETSWALRPAFAFRLSQGKRPFSPCAKSGQMA